MLFKDKSLDIITQTIIDGRQQVRIDENNVREKLKDFYRGIQSDDKYLTVFGFKDDDGQEMIPRGSINLTRKIIDKISLVYKYAPSRQLDSTVQANKQKKLSLKEGEMFEPEQDIYDQWCGDHPWFNRSLKTAERYKNLLHRLLYRPFYFPDALRWQFFIETDYEPHFLDGDPLHPFAYSYPIKRNTTNTNFYQALKEEDFYVFWSDELYFIYSAEGQIYTKPPWNPDAPDYGGENPFKKSPLIELIKADAVDRYDESPGEVQLIEANQQINVAMMNINMCMHYQMYNQAYLSGLDELQAVPKTGPYRTWILGPPEASAGILQYNPQLIQSMQTIREQIQTVAWTYDVSVEWAVEGTPASGFSLIVRNIDLLESRQDDVEVAEIQENDIYQSIAYQQDYYRRTGQLSQEERKTILPLNTKPIVDFEEIDFPVNQAEEIDRWKEKISANVATPVEWIQSENPDMTEEEAMQKFEKNKRINKKYGGFQDLIREKIEEQGGVINAGQ